MLVQEQILVQKQVLVRELVQKLALVQALVLAGRARSRRALPTARTLAPALAARAPRRTRLPIG